MIAVLVMLATADESALRAAFEKAKDVAPKLEALKKLAGAKEEKSIEVLAKALKDPEKDVRKTAAETLETAEDVQGRAIKPLGELMNDKKEEPELRLAAAKALGKAHFKAEPLEAFFQCIGGITNQDRTLFKFGADVTAVLNKFAGEDFGMGKQTASLWEQWWTDNKEKIRQEDARKRAALKKD